MTEDPLPSNQEITIIGERFRKYSEHPGDRKKITTYRAYRCSNLDILFNAVAHEIIGAQSVLSLRVKRIDTIVRKLRRPGVMRLPQMDDVIGLRIVAASCDHQEMIRERICKGFPVKRVKDYRESSTPNGYRAVHVILEQELLVNGSGLSRTYPCELQIRTYNQHLWATMSESFGEQVKEGGGTEEERAYLTELSLLIREWEGSNPGQFQFNANGLKMSSALSFFVVHYNKTEGIIIQLFSFGADIREALKQLVYLEDQPQQDARETVLLAVVDSGEELHVTHLRYFKPRGIPSLPDFLAPTLPRP